MNPVTSAINNKCLIRNDKDSLVCRARAARQWVYWLDWSNKRLNETFKYFRRRK